MSSVRPKSIKSDLKQSSHFRIGRPFLLASSTVIDSTLLTASDGSRLRTCPNHRSLPSLNFSETDTTPKDILIAEFVVISHRVLPHVHQSILISAASILLTLPDSYDQLIINLTNSNVTSLVFDDVAAAVLKEENQRKNKEDRQVNLQQAETLTTMRGRSTERGQSNSHKHGRSKSRSKKNFKSYNFGKKGHLKKDYWSLNKNSNPQGNTANTSDDEDDLYCESSTTVEGSKRYADTWLIDSGATYHTTSRRELFHHFEPVSGGSVYSCNDHALDIVGVRTIKLKMYDGTIKIVRDIRHVFRGALVVLKGEKITTNLYMLKGETLLEAKASVASCSSDSAMLWNQKLGHMSEQGMKVLVEQKLLPGLTKERRYQKTVQSGEHSSIKWSGRADEQNLVRKNKSNVEGCKLRKIILGRSSQNHLLFRESSSINCNRAEDTNGDVDCSQISLIFCTPDVSTWKAWSLILKGIVMAASIAYIGGHLQYGVNLCKGQSYKQAVWVPGVTFNGCLQRELSWSCGVSKFPQISQCNLFRSPSNKKLKSFRTFTASAYLRDGTTKYFDFAVIGSGVAGLRYALEVAKHGSVAVITKAEPHESNTNYAQGGVSAVLCPSDSIESHMRDTIVAGAYLCDEETVKIVCTEGPDRIRELIAMGASFDHGEDGNLHLAREDHRIVHAADMTGREIERALLEAVINDPNISVFKHHFAIDLLTCQDGLDTVCHGVDALNTETQEVTTGVRFISKATLLASGGAGHIYPSTTNPLVATGDGMAMAHRAQAVISNMEWFHPTALADEGLPVKPKKTRENAFLITEAVRGDGGILYNLSMERFMPLYDGRAELAPRDVVARSIDDQLKKRNEKYVLLDISHKPREKILSHFPNIANECLQHGLDITQQPIPVVPAAHYMCGGVRAGLQGETSVHGLYVAGEVACTGLHGANRLASNSLLEALVFARRAVQPSIDHIKSSNLDLRAADLWTRPLVPKSLGKTEQKISELEAKWETYLFEHGWQQTMVAHEACEMRNLFCCAKLVLSSALARHESRGLHYMIDFPHLEESKRLPTVIFPSSGTTSTWSSRQLHQHSTC
ncbi:L-aspartate oxidase [Hibiscus syriacus]|uniref:L-aspartate oxidase n=1 Tax=Hibiscus syriacus TaxID=106335 RepID=A0A6A3CFZ3_HIBSY|nr:L-aspartate oxidase [Hibiscus syriacus]